MEQILHLKVDRSDFGPVRDSGSLRHLRYYITVTADKTFVTPYPWLEKPGGGQDEPYTRPHQFHFLGGTRGRGDPV